MRYLSTKRNQITDVSLRAIIKCCTKIKQITVSDCFGVSKQMKELIRVKYTMPLLMHQKVRADFLNDVVPQWDVNHFEELLN